MLYLLIFMLHFCYIRPSKIVKVSSENKAIALFLCHVFVAGKVGKFYFSVSAGDSSPNYDLKCRNWFWQQRSYWWKVVWGWMYTRVCPCDQRRVMSDRRWKFDVKEYFSSNGERICYYERRPYWISTQV